MNIYLKCVQYLNIQKEKSDNTQYPDASRQL